MVKDVWQIEEVTFSSLSTLTKLQVSTNRQEIFMTRTHIYADTTQKLFIENAKRVIYLHVP